MRLTCTVEDTIIQKQGSLVRACLYLSQKPHRRRTARLDGSLRASASVVGFEEMIVLIDFSRGSQSLYCRSRRASWRYNSSAPRHMAIPTAQ